MTFLFFLVIFLFLIVCLTLCGVIIIQEGKGGGLGASFGGDVSDSLFGASTADVLKRFTGWMAAIFLIACVVLSLWTEVMGRTKVRTTPYDIEYMED
jgi:preprotein translocase subunit SecG